MTTPDWKTLLLIGEGRGGQPERWSSSPSCDSGFSSTYSTTYQYYCGYWAFDLTDTANPAVISSSVTSVGWTNPVIKPTAANAPYLGDPWSRMTIGKVRFDNSGTDKWVAFVGGGYGSADCTGGGGCNTTQKMKGKGFYVIDLTNGNVLWSYNNSNDANMVYSFPASPAIVDHDNDGYIDTAYIGDMGGNMWRFKFCSQTDINANNCSTSMWTGGKVLDTSGASSDWSRPLYNYPSVTTDKAGSLWVFWATGDKSDPTNTTGTAGKVIGLKDNDRTTTYTPSSLQDVTNPSQACNDASKDGWFVSFTGNEKAISDITVFGGLVYFTTYVPSTSTDPCNISGYSNIYAINYLTCGGMLDPTNSGTLVRSMFVSYGIASAPIVSMRPGGSIGVDLYITQSGGGGQNAGTVRVNFNPPTLANKTNMLFWRDLRLQ
jgi:type IV pilus assembly protein PilY1